MYSLTRFSPSIAVLAAKGASVGGDTEEQLRQMPAAEWQSSPAALADPDDPFGFFAAPDLPTPVCHEKTERHWEKMQEWKETKL